MEQELVCTLGTLLNCSPFDVFAPLLAGVVAVAVIGMLRGLTK